MPVKNSSYLTEEQRAHFLEHGWVRIPKAIPPENVTKFADDVWIRLGYDKNDKSTWKEERLHMPRQREMTWREFSPKIWGAMCDLVGGEERIDPNVFDKVGNSLIVNFGTDEWENKTISPKDLEGWHVDGNWFTHFLDSSEQAVLCLQIFSDIAPRGGGTYICEDGIKHVAQWLHDRPEGTVPKLTDPDGKRAMDAIQHCSTFVELTGEAGDVVLCHGLMPHCASKNHLRIPRLITSPHIALKEPFNFNRENPEDYSLIEQKILKELGVTGLPDWKITGTRQRFTPPVQAKKNARVHEELKRMQEHAARTGGVVESIHLNGIAKYGGGTDA